MTDIRQSPEYAKYLEKLNWASHDLRFKNSELRIYLRRIPVLGNFVKIHHPPIRLDDSELKEIAKKYKAFSIQVTFSPSKTLVLDLKPSLEKIFENFSKDTRYEIRKAQENVARKRNPSEVPPDGTKGDNITVQQSDDISSFTKIWTETALRRHFWLPFEKEIVSLYKAFGDKACLLMAYRLQTTANPSPSPIHKSSIINHKFPLAGALILIHEKSAHYFHAASTLEGRRLQAPSLVIWEAIQLAKQRGCTSFDFEGIFDPRDKDTKNWQGFTRFKKGFGGKEVEYPLTKTKFYFFNFQF